MARLELASPLAEDFERIFEYFSAHEAPERTREIINAFDVLATNPLIGRPAPRDKRELIIGRGGRGYIALYRYVAEIDTVFVLAIRSQREAGYKHE
jgi:plasmid stabilization system protein ParE